MIKLLIGGSPCTYWSIAQKNHRETEPSGIGWELFKNYIIAKEKFKPDFFLYENNKSAAMPIKQKIREELKVWDGTLLTEDTGARYIEINSALVSAQNRQRFYVHNCGEVGLPKDRGILLKDILESGQGWTEKSYAVTTRDGGAIPEDTLKRKRHTMIAEPVRVGEMGSKSQWARVYSISGKSVTIKANGGFGASACAIPINELKSGKGRCVTAGYAQQGVKHIMESNYSGNPNKQTWDCAAEPVIFQISRGYNAGGIKYNKSPTLTSNGSWENNNKVIEPVDALKIKKNIYEVKDGKIIIKGKEYPIKLKDGYYIIRKLTVTECARLQTMPDDYCRAVSASQGYKGLGNGWTAEVIIHILQGALKDVPKDEEIVVLSMYDGIGTGRYCLDKMGFTNVKYYAYEIDKFAMQIALSNYPDIIECGDAYKVREDGWEAGR